MPFGDGLLFCLQKIRQFKKECSYVYTFFSNHYHSGQIGWELKCSVCQPSVLGEIIVGILLGPSVFGLVHASDTLATFSTIGVILLMFIAGLETDLDEFKRSAKSSTFVGLWGIIFPLFLGNFAGQLMELSDLQSWFLGVMLSATSVSISVQALKEMNKLKSREGTTILGAAVIDDVVVMIILAFLISFAGDANVSLTTLVIKKFLFFLVAIFVAWKSFLGFYKNLQGCRLVNQLYPAL